MPWRNPQRICNGLETAHDEKEIPISVNKKQSQTNPRMLLSFERILFCKEIQGFHMFNR